jgi:hypothetical protein
MAVKHQGQGEPCKCGHHRLYHASAGACMVLNCKCQVWEARSEDAEGK